MRRADPSAKPPNQVVPALIGAGLGIVILLVSQLTPTGPPLWEAVLPPVAAILVALVVRRYRIQKVRRAMDASEAVLHAGGEPIPVHLSLRWGGTATKPDNRITASRSGDGALLGYLTMVIEPSQFDPRDQLWLHGRPEAGEAVALQAGDGRPPMLTARAFSTDDTLGPFVEHPQSDLVNRLLGWTGSRPGVPVVASGKIGIEPDGPAWPPALAEAVARSVARMRRSSTVAITALLLSLPLFAALHLALVESVVLTAVAWGAAWLWSRRGNRSWISRPVADALVGTERLGTDDARYVAAAMSVLRFGLPPTGADAASGPDAGGDADGEPGGRAPAGQGTPPLPWS